MNKIFWTVFSLSLLGDFIIVYILAKYYPEYNHLKDVMSVMGNDKSPAYKIYNVWLIILGIMMIIFGVSIYSQYKNISDNLSKIILVIMAVYGIGGCILSGIFGVNETREIETIHSKIHGTSAGIGFMALTFIPLLIGLLFKTERNVLAGNLSIVIFIICLGLFILFIMSEKKQFQKTIIGYSGLWQRLLLGCMYVPLIIMSIKNIILY